MPVNVDEEESDRDRGYADDEYDDGAVADGDDRGDLLDVDDADDDEGEEEEEEEDVSELEVVDDELQVVTKVDLAPLEVGQPTLAVVKSQSPRLRAKHQRSQSDVYTIRSADERLGDGLVLSKFGDLMNSEKICRSSRVSQILRETHNKTVSWLLSLC